jgi:hypothetical protein
MRCNLYSLVISVFLIVPNIKAQHGVGLGLSNYKTPFISYSYQKKNIEANVQLSCLQLWKNTIRPYVVDTADFKYADTLTLNLFQGEKRRPGVTIQFNCFLYNKNQIATGIGIGYFTSSILKKNASIGAYNSWIENSDTTASISMIFQQDSLIRNRMGSLQFHWGFHLPVGTKFNLLFYFSTSLAYSKQTLKVEGYDRFAWGLVWPDSDIGYSYTIRTSDWHFQPITRPTIQLTYRF